MFISRLIKRSEKRGKQEVRYNRDFQIDEKYRGMGHTLIKTYGCQMNAHDTEVIAGYT